MLELYPDPIQGKAVDQLITRFRKKWIVNLNQNMIVRALNKGQKVKLLCIKMQTIPVTHRFIKITCKKFKQCPC